MPNIMQIVIMLFYLGNDNFLKSLYMFSTDFFLCIFVQQAFEPTDVEHLDMRC